MIAHNLIVRKSCKENNLTYFDTSKNFMKGLEDSIEYLLE